MSKLKDEFQTIRDLPDYVKGSLIVKSSDDNGTVLKWLKNNGDGTSDRQQKFIQTDNSQKGLPYNDRDVVATIIVNDPM